MRAAIADIDARAAVVASKPTTGRRHVVEQFERYLGDPHSRDSVVSFERSLQLDETEALPESEYAALDAWGLNKYFVPALLGGGLCDLDEMMLLMRSLFSRDAGMGLGYGVSTFIAALPIWHSGNAQLRERVAATVLQGGAVSALFHERTHGNDVLSNESSAVRDGSSYLLRAEKWIINNVARAQGATLFARTAANAGARGHSLFYLDGTDLQKGDVLPRIPTLGVRCCQISGWRTDSCRVPEEALVGHEGGAYEIVAKSFQVTRALLPGMALGILDTAIRLCYDFLYRRRLYGRPAIAIPLVKRDLADAFTDLVQADCISMAASRMVQAMPEQLSLTSSIAKFSVPSTLGHAMNSLSVLLGARHYLRDGEYAHFQKLMRDFPVVSIGHASSGVCLSLIVQQLPQLASYGDGARRIEPEEFFGSPAFSKLRAVFDLDEKLPQLELGQLALSNRGRDPVLQGLRPTASHLKHARAHPGASPSASEQIASLALALCDVHEDILSDVRADYSGVERSDPRWYAAARRYCELYVAGCAFWFWYFNRQLSIDDSEFRLADERWLIRILERVLRIPSRDAGWCEWAVDTVHRSIERQRSLGVMAWTVATQSRLHR